AAAHDRRALRAAALAGFAAWLWADLIGAQTHLRLLPRDIDAYYARYAPLLDGLRARQGLDRTYLSTTARGDDPLPYFSDLGNAGLAHRLYQVDSYAGGVAWRRLETFLGELGGLPPPRPGQLEARLGHVPLHLTTDNLPRFNLLGARFVLTAAGDEARLATPQVLAGWQVIDRQARVVLYENPTALPRAFLVDSATPAASPEAALQALAHVDLARQAVIEAPLVPPFPSRPSGSDQAGTVAIAHYAANRVALEVVAQRDALLVLTDQHFPGWRATLDGNAVPIARANYLFRAVRVPSGTHRIEMRYAPRALQLGALGSAVGGLIALGLLVRRPRAGGAA
ncbi:MAG: YfhO family protein, partial [Deltaproteobacteria bacterium]|nr:YfhO family protein [Deltaproteobacteria bacterium]